VQQNQLAAANGFDQQLKRLRECKSSLKKLCSLSISNDNSTVLECFIPEQVTAFKCVWQQKVSVVFAVPFGHVNSCDAFGFQYDLA